LTPTAGNCVAYHFSQAFFARVEGKIGRPTPTAIAHPGSCYQGWGLAIISQKMASTDANAGNPQANHHRNRV